MNSGSVQMRGKGVAMAARRAPASGSSRNERSGMSGKDNRFDGDLIGVDVGGTFTDPIRLDQASGAVRLAVASTLDNQAFGVMNAVAEAESDLSRVALVIHGTTTTTNAVPSASSAAPA